MNASLQLILASVTSETELLAGGDVAADRLAVDLRQPLDRTGSPGHPQPEHFSNLELARGTAECDLAVGAKPDLARSRFGEVVEQRGDPMVRDRPSSPQPTELAWS